MHHLYKLISVPIFIFKVIHKIKRYNALKILESVEKIVLQQLISHPMQKILFVILLIIIASVDITDSNNVLMDI